MTRERAKELLPIIEHFANGGEVEWKHKPGAGIMDDWEPCHQITRHPDYDYRIAQPKPMTFMEAVEAMKQGKKVKRAKWIKGFGPDSLSLSGNEFVFNRSKASKTDINYVALSDIEATDWEIVK
jgi:hypothetical protein